MSRPPAPPSSYLDPASPHAKRGWPFRTLTLRRA